MPFLKITCHNNPEDYHDVEISPRDMTIIEWNKGETYAYRFRCPECSYIDYNITNTCMVDILAATGVKIEQLDLPKTESGHGKPINNDEIQKFLTKIDNLSPNDLIN